MCNYLNIHFDEWPWPFKVTIQGHCGFCLFSHLRIGARGLFGYCCCYSEWQQIVYLIKRYVELHSLVNTDFVLSVEEIFLSVDHISRNMCDLLWPKAISPRFLIWCMTCGLKQLISVITALDFCWNTMTAYDHCASLWLLLAVCEIWWQPGKGIFWFTIYVKDCDRCKVPRHNRNSLPFKYEITLPQQMLWDGNIKPDSCSIPWYMCLLFPWCLLNYSTSPLILHKYSSQICIQGGCMYECLYLCVFYCIFLYVCVCYIQSIYTCVFHCTAPNALM